MINVDGNSFRAGPQLGHNAIVLDSHSKRIAVQYVGNFAIITEESAGGATCTDGSHPHGGHAGYATKTNDGFLVQEYQSVQDVDAYVGRLKRELLGV